MMNKALLIPPLNKSSLTPPEKLVEKLSVLVGQKFRLTKKTRTDGSNARKQIASLLEQDMPPQAELGSYIIVPPRKKGVPKILREYVDTYIVTTGNAYNLQVWNRNPASDSIQVQYSDDSVLSAKDVRFIFMRVHPEKQEIRSIIVLTSAYIEQTFGRFGKPTIKHQLIIPERVRQEIIHSSPPVLFYPDTDRIASLTLSHYLVVDDRIHDRPQPGRLFSLEVLFDRLIDKLVGEVLAPEATKNRGQALEFRVAKLLGYPVTEGDVLAGGYPDLKHQLLEIKLQDSTTVDLGRYSPQFEEAIPDFSAATTVDVRYLIALMDVQTGLIQGLVLCPGARLGEHFTYVSDTSYKCQRSIPMAFFDRFDGRAVFNPSE